MKLVPNTARSKRFKVKIAGSRPVNPHIFGVIGFTRILGFALESKIQAKSGGAISWALRMRRKGECKSHLCLYPVS